VEVEFNETLTLELVEASNAGLTVSLTGTSFTGTIIDNDSLVIGPVNPGNPDPDNPDSYVTDGSAAAVTVEGDELVFILGQS
jgi:hypothetical protein